jgi:hypothetical protein
LFDFEKYFLAAGGRWTFEWDVPSSVLGIGGMTTGVVVYQKLADGFYQATSQAKDEGGSYSTKETIAYAREDHTLTRYVDDSRGFSYLEIGHVDGSLGGVYGISYESAPFTVKGHTVQLKHFMRLISTAAYRVDAKVATDDTAYVNYGIWWFQLEIKTPH